MKLMKCFSMAIIATTLLCGSAFAQTVTVVDFGAEMDGCCGDIVHDLFTGTIDSSDPAALQLLQNNAGTAQVDNPAISIGLGGGATLEWTGVSAWNNAAGGVNPGETFFLNRFDDPNDTNFTVTTANPTDLVTIDFIGGVGRSAQIDIAGATIIVPATGDGVAAPFAWTNVVNGLAGTQTGELSSDLDVAGEEGNVGAIRVTITPGAVVPEPSSLALLGLGAMTAVIRRRRS